MLRGEGESSEEGGRRRRERHQHPDRRPQRPRVGAAGGVDEVVGVSGHERRAGGEWRRRRRQRRGWGRCRGGERRETRYQGEAGARKVRWLELGLGLGLG